jgi:Arc/MetJ-type ribon-helix-helix transcriptional regulator
MDGERITLRLEPEDLELLDDFVRKRPEFSNRSQLARVAIRAFIDGAQGSPVSEDKTNRISVELPKAALHVIKGMIREGIYTTPEEAIKDAVRKEFLPKEHLDEAKKRALEVRKNTLEILD